MTSKRKFVKKAVSIGLSATLALSAVGFSALADTSKEDVFPSPATIKSVDSSILTATSQRAASEIPLVFGVNVVAGTLFNGPIDMAGTSVNETPDPYLWNYNYNNYDENEGTASPAYNDGSVVASLGTLHNADGLYSSGGGNQVYFGGAGYVDTFFGFNSTVYAEIVKDGGSAVVTDVQTGSATSRLYAWTEMGKALSGYLTTNTDKSVRYGDPYTIAVNLEQFSAGIPYYISYLIDSNQISKKTAAFVTSATFDTEGVGTYTCENPSTHNDVRSDMFAEANNFNFVTGEYTADQLSELKVNLVVLSATGYSYDGGSTGQSDTLSNKKESVVNDLTSVYGEDMPIVMSGTNYNITIGNNGYNYSPITCMFMPYIQVYAYMDELAALDEEDKDEINPAAMVRFMIDNFFHVNDDGTSTCDGAKVTEYYIGSNWVSVSEGVDQVPDVDSYVYDESTIKDAIITGVKYALSLDGDNEHQLLGAYRTTDNAYIYLTDTAYATTSAPSGTTNYLTLAVKDSEGNTVSNLYINLDAIDSNIANYYNNENDNGGKFNWGYDLETTLQNYLDHMDDHVWVPHTDASGAYYYVATE